MASRNDTPMRINPDDLKYPGWNLGWEKPGDKHDPIMDALIRRNVERELWDLEVCYIGDYLYGQTTNDKFRGKTLAQTIGEKFGDRESRAAEAEQQIAATSPDDVHSEWMEGAYTQYGVDGRVEWVSYSRGLGLFSGWEDFSILEDADFVVNMEPVLNGNESLIKTTIQSPPRLDILPKHKDMPSDETWLYRMFDQEGVLLYIGISKDAFARFSQHAKDKPWIGQVARWERESFATRNAALAAEKSAIKSEFPLYNVVHNEGSFR